MLLSWHVQRCAGATSMSRTFGSDVYRTKCRTSARGPVQLTFCAVDRAGRFARTRLLEMAVATQKEADEQGENRTMGGKNTIPYGLYRPWLCLTRVCRKDRIFRRRPCTSVGIA